MTDTIARPSFSDIYDSLSQVDDELIEQHLGLSSDDVFEAIGNPSIKDWNNAVRLCEFVVKVRANVPPNEARDQVRALTKAQLAGLLEAFMGIDEAMPDEPVTEAGKDDSDDA